jgi:hypothetical protein
LHAGFLRKLLQIERHAGFLRKLLQIERHAGIYFRDVQPSHRGGRCPRAKFPLLLRHH